MCDYTFKRIPSNQSLPEGYEFVGSVECARTTTTNKMMNAFDEVTCYISSGLETEVIVQKSRHSEEDFFFVKYK